MKISYDPKTADIPFSGSEPVKSRGCRHCNTVMVGLTLVRSCHHHTHIRRSLVNHPILAILATISLTGIVSAQIGGSGSIQGTVSDPSGAVMPGATISATNVGTGVKTTRQTTAAGRYILSPLPPGEYNVTAGAPGFQTVVQQHVIVDALSEVSLDLALKVGAESQQITVVDTPPAINTSDASMSQTVRNDVYGSLPLAMGNAPRDPTAFTQLLPGVTTSSASGNTAGNVLGAQDHSQEIYVEGLPVTNPVAMGESRTLGLGVSVEAVDQFQLETAGAPVMYQGQGASNYVLKSGTNQFHGAAYEYLRNTELDARGFFAKVRSIEHQNEFGFNIGGPIKKNRMFFFANYDGFRFTQGAQPSFQSIPAIAERNGNFSALPTTIYDPATLNCSDGPCTRKPFPGNIIPANRISAISKSFQSFLPDPVNGNLLSNYLGTVPVGYHDNSVTSKVDFNVNEKNTLYALFSHGHRSQTTPYRGQTLPLPYANTRLVDELPTTAMLKHTYVATPNLLNQLSYGFSRLNVPITNATISGDYPTKAGLTGLPPGEAASSFPEISFSGPNAPDGWRGTNSRAFSEALNTFTLQDNVQWTHGKHSVTFGAQMQWLQANEKTRTYGSLATWNFSNVQTQGFSATGTPISTSGNAYASFLLGALNSALVQQDSVVETGGRYRDFSWWLQDNYKLSQRLTLNLGLRHDIWSPYVEVLDRESFFNPDAPNPAAGGRPGILEFYGNGTDSCHCRTTVDTYLKNFGPRIGLAFTLTPRTVIRAGYSIMYTHRGAVGGRGGARVGTDILGFTASPSFTSPDNYSPAFYWNNGVPPYQQPPFFDPAYGTGYNGTGNPPATVTYGDPSLGGIPPRYQNWNFNIERAVTAGMTVSAAYVGSNGHFLGGGGRGIWSDQINPRYLVLGNLLNQAATPANLAAANAILPGIALPYPSFSGSIAQMLRPFPQYAGLTDIWGDVGNSNYNSFQLSMNQRLSHGLTFHFNYTYAKAFDDTASNPVTGQTATQRSAYSWTIEKARTQIPAHVLNLFAVYRLPFGKGGNFSTHSRFADAIVSGWQVSSIVTYRSGTPIGTIGAACTLPFAGGCYANYNPSFQGPVRINGGYGSGDLLGSNPPAFLDKTAFLSPAAYTYGDTPRTGAYGIYNPGSYGFDANVRREFAIRESVKFIFQADAINALNLVTFSAPSTNITSSNFGRITGQSNTPRLLQLSGRIVF
jgi:hypothetical protein